MGLKRLEPTKGEANSMARLMEAVCLGPLNRMTRRVLVREIMDDDGPMRDLAVHLLRCIVHGAEEKYGFAHEGVPPAMFDKILDLPGIVPSAVRDARRTRFENLVSGNETDDQKERLSGA